MAVETILKEKSKLDSHGFDLATKALSFEFDKKTGELNYSGDNRTITLMEIEPDYSRAFDCKVPWLTKGKDRRGASVFFQLNPPLAG